MKLQVMVLLLEPYSPSTVRYYDNLCFTLKVSRPFKAEIVLRHKYQEFDTIHSRSVQKAAVQRREQAIG